MVNMREIDWKNDSKILLNPYRLLIRQIDWLRRATEREREREREEGAKYEYDYDI